MMQWLEILNYLLWVGLNLSNLNDIEYLLDYKNKEPAINEPREEKILKLINGKK